LKKRNLRIKEFMAKKSDIIKFQKKQKHLVRNVNRCQLCGRSRGYIRRFGLCRLCFREKAHKGELPGVIKASW
jgi:small subunit ribosomal protein S14